MATKIAATGTQLQVFVAAAWHAVGSIRSLSGPGFEVDTVDVTTHDSPGAVEEIIPTILRPGEVEAEMLFDPADADHELLLSRMETKALASYRMVFPDVAATTWEFDAYVIGFELESPHDDAFSATVTFKTTGIVDRTPV